ncbi:MAG: UvrD-helicase domain-containing protein [Phycisphaerae bacterium]
MIGRDDLLADLTQPQRAAVTHADGPLLVLAGAGSGKTRVITRRAGALARTVRPWEVLAITFTNKAAEEMRERIAHLGVARGMWVCTFHALCARLLREHAELAGLGRNFTIFDQADRLAAVRDSIVAVELSVEHYRPRTMEWQISSAKNAGLDVETYAERNRDFTGQAVARVWRAYDERMRRQNAVDFDDLLCRTAELLGSHPAVRDALEERFRYLLIDEYQDTNRPQYLIAARLSAQRRNLCATGDPDQSIYGWRGADISNILNFEHDHPDATVVRLEQNYRSTPAILRAASGLIRHNQRRKHKELWTENASGEPVRVWACADEHDEARRIAADIAALRQQGGLAGEVAILYRVTALTRVLEDALRQAQIPYQIARGVEFYARKEIKDVLAYLRLIVNPSDDAAFRRAIAEPARGVGKTTLDRLAEFCAGRGLSLDAGLAHAGEIEGLRTARAKLKSFAALLAELRGLERRPVRAVVDAVLKRSGLERALNGDADPEKAALNNVLELVSAAADYDAQESAGTLEGWLEQVSLVSDTDRLNLADGAVTLMTLHAAKGLEFAAVYVAGLEEELLPHARAIADGAGEIEEERRLCFVGMTRAKRRLTLTHARYRAVRGLTQRTLESRFLRELPEDAVVLLDATEPDDEGPRRSVEREYDDEPADVAEWYPGRRVRHEDYGDGTIVRLEPRGRTAWVRVRFARAGEKTFALSHAPISLLEA